MPLTTKGAKILRAMRREYGAKRGERVFYASQNAGKISGVDVMPTKTFKSHVRDAIAAGASARDALAAAVIAPKRALTLGAVRDAARRGMSARDSLASGLHAYAGAVTKASEMATQDDWSPEARAAAAKARKEHAKGTAVRVNAEGIKGHGARGHVDNNPDKAGGRHFVRTAGGEVHGPFHAHQLTPTGGAAAGAAPRREERVPTGSGGTVARSRVNSLTKKLLGWKDAATGDAHEGFAKLDHSLAHRKGVHNAAALAAWIGRRKDGKKAFQAKAAAGR